MGARLQAFAAVAAFACGCAALVALPRAHHGVSTLSVREAAGALGGAECPPVSKQVCADKEKCTDKQPPKTGDCNFSHPYCAYQIITEGGTNTYWRCNDQTMDQRCQPTEQNKVCVAFYPLHQCRGLVMVECQEHTCVDVEVFKDVDCTGLKALRCETREP